MNIVYLLKDNYIGMQLQFIKFSPIYYKIIGL